MPLTYTVSLLEGIWTGEAWWAHRFDVAALAVVFIACTALSAKVFCWDGFLRKLSVLEVKSARVNC